MTDEDDGKAYTEYYTLSEEREKFRLFLLLLSTCLSTLLPPLAPNGRKRMMMTMSGFGAERKRGFF